MHFSLRDDDLIIRAQHNQTNEILALIPTSNLWGDLPPALVNGHVHWLDLSTKTIEVRPVEQLWERSSKNWRIEYATGQYHMCKGHETLVDVRSQTWEMVSRCFEGFGSVEHRTLLVTTSLINVLQRVPALQLSVALPGYGFSFFVNEQDELESRDFKNMVYDEHQSIGTLFGLEGLLVLRSKELIPGALTPRRVLIPTEGNVPEDCGDHLAECYTYEVDTELGCLIGNDSPTSTHFLAHLHAKTSCHRADPLTGKTGTQAALRLLQSALCRSVMELKAVDHSPYWTSTKYPRINSASRAIQNRYYWLDSGFGGGSEADRAQEERAARRAARVFPTQQTSLADSFDVDYSTPKADVELEDIASAAASAVYRYTPTVDTIIDWIKLWGKSTHLSSAASVSHDYQLDSSFMQTFKAQDIMQKRDGSRSRFQLLFLLPAMAYCSPSHQAAFLSMLIVLATRAESYSRNPPIHSDCNIVDGYRPTEEMLRDHMKMFLLPDRIYQTRVVNAAIKHLLKDWPSLAPPIVVLDSLDWDVASLMTSLRSLFASCYRNFGLKEDLMLILAGPGLLTVSHCVPHLRYTSDERTPALSQITLDQLLSRRSPPELPLRSTLLRYSHGHQGRKTPELSNDIPALVQLLSSLPTNSSFHSEYLARTCADVRTRPQIIHTVAAKDHIDALQKHFVDCRTNYADALNVLKDSLGPTTDLEQTLDRFGQWPPITADVLLECLASASPINLPGPWKKCLVSFALLLLELQRARRLLRFSMDGLEEEFTKELDNEQCDGWDPEKYPDWLLIQVRF